MTRQEEIEALDVGDSVSVCRRVDLAYGITAKQISRHVAQVAGILHSQTHRARQKTTEAKYTVENGRFITGTGSLMLVTVCTRIN